MRCWARSRRKASTPVSTTPKKAMRDRMRARSEDTAPLPMLAAVIDEFYEWFRIMPMVVDVLDLIGCA